MLIYPDKQALSKPEGSGTESTNDDGEQFWQTFFSYFSGGCDSDWDGDSKKPAAMRKIIEQPVQQLAASNQSDKNAENSNAATEIKIEQKPFYFVIPPGPFVSSIPGSFPGAPPANFPGRPIYPRVFYKPAAPQLTSFGSEKQQSTNTNGFQ